LAEADNLRRIMGKKKEGKMIEQRDVFVTRAIRKGIDKVIAEKVFEDMAYFAGYGFNKSHSAAYALIAYQTAFLKANYPVQFMAALLSSEMNNTDKLVDYINECKDMDVPILPPDVNESFSGFTVVGNSIRFGLAAIKNVGKSAINRITQERIQNGKFKSLCEFLSRIGASVVNRRVNESMIRCGAFDSMGFFRSQLMEGLDAAMGYAARGQQDRINGQITLFEHEESFESPEPEVPTVDEWPSSEIFIGEKELLGFYVTGHPLSEYTNTIKMLTRDRLSQLPNINDGSEIIIGGVFNRITVKMNKRNEKWAIAHLEDLEAMSDLLFFSKVYDKLSAKIKEDTPVIVFARVDRRDDTPKLIANDIINLDDSISERIIGIKINIDNNTVSENDLEKLRELLLLYSGNCNVSFWFDVSQGKKFGVCAGKKYRVSPSIDLSIKIEEIIGTGKVSIKLRKEFVDDNKNRKRWNKPQEILS
jgi:DNA polymerase III subunit alpha